MITNKTTNRRAAAQDAERREWVESFEALVAESGPERAAQILDQLRAHAERTGVPLPFSANTPYVNTIPYSKQAPFPGDQEIERRIKSIIRWNALAMVVRANRVEHNIGGHISTYASQATLFEVGFNHFFRAHTKDFEGDFIFFQGHAVPGVYARAFLEGRLTVQQMENFRRELRPEGGLPLIPTPGSCRSSGNFPRSRWVSVPSWPSIRHASIATWKTGG